MLDVMRPGDAVPVDEVGIAVGPGADAVVESAGITPLSGNLAGILKARALAPAAL